MVVGELADGGQGLLAARHHLIAAPGEGATAGFRCPERDLPLAAPLQLGVDALLGVGHRRDEQLGVGVLGVVQDLVHLAPLHHVPDVHYRQILGHVASGGDVVGDVEHGDAELVLHLLHQVEDADANGDVEHGGGLVRQHHFGLHRQVAGDVDPLALAAGELVRVLGRGGLGGGEPHLLQQAIDHVGQITLVDHLAVQQQGAGDVVVDGVGRVQRTERILPHHLHALTVVEQGGALVELLQIAAAIEDAAARELVHLGDDLGDGALAGAGLSHHCQSAAPVQVEGDVREGPHLAALDGIGVDGEVLVEVLDFDNGGVGFGDLHDRHP